MDDYPWDSGDSFADEFFAPKKTKSGKWIILLSLALAILFIILLLDSISERKKEVSEEIELYRKRELGEQCATDFQCKSGYCGGSDSPWIFKDGRCMVR